MVKGEYFAFNFAANDLAIFTEFPQLVMMIFMHLFVVTKLLLYIKITKKKLLITKEFFFAV